MSIKKSPYFSIRTFTLMLKVSVIGCIQIRIPRSPPALISAMDYRY